MRILYVAQKYDYGDPNLGFGYEHYNFFHTLSCMGADILYFDTSALLIAMGKKAMSRRLVEVAKTEKPDVMFTTLFKDELEPDAVREISDDTDTVTFNWFGDDHWRFDNFSRHWAPCFNWVSTTANSALPKYAAMGYANVIKTQWAANPFTYRPPQPGDPDNPAEAPDLSFIGRSYGLRPILLERLAAEGMPVAHWGPNAPNGKIDQDAMVRVFGRSKINLNFSGSSMVGKQTLKARVKQTVGRLARKAGMRAAATAAHRAIGGKPRALAERRVIGQESEQIKGRNFEVPACGGFLLSGMADDLQSYYEIGSEIVVYDSEQDLVDKCRHYLAHDDERRAIARAGYERTIREHTFIHRFAEMFDRFGKPLGRADDILARGPLQATVEDVPAPT